MDAEIKTKWIEALRSGEFKQGEGVLLNEDGAYCCLGVLARIQGITVEDLDGKTLDLEDKNAGLTLTQRSMFAEMNDGRCGRAKHSFAEIADYIEQNL